MDVSFSFAVQSGCPLSSGVFGWVSLKGILVLALPALPAPFPLSLSLSLFTRLSVGTQKGRLSYRRLEAGKESERRGPGV